MPKIHVLTVDDSSLMQKILKTALMNDADIELVDQAYNCNQARDMIKHYNPDVVTLDVEMPGMNGIEFLERLMSARPLPVIMFSSHTAEGTEITLRALELGAVDFLQKPRQGLEKTLDYLREALIPKIKNASQTSPHKLYSSFSSPSDNLVTKTILPYSQNMPFDIIAIGASTGGVGAIREILEKLPDNLPPIVITQHMPEGYTERFAERLSRDCKIKVVQAENNQILKYGYAYIAPGTHHLRVLSRNSREYYTELGADNPVSGHRPSVDAMFSSLASSVPSGRILGIILTGMGRDGANGLLKIRQGGNPTFGQNKETCVVYGMPKVAYEEGAVQTELPLNQIADAILNSIMPLHKHRSA